MHAWPRHDERSRATGGLPGRWRGVAVTICVVAGGLYVLLTVLVMAHLTDSLDEAVRQWFRPDDVWGTAQLRADTVVEGLKPPRVALVLPVVAGLTALARRSWRPVVVAVQVAAATSVLVVATKVLVGRPDPNGEVVTVGGSFPSGHTAVLLAVLGGCLLAVSIPGVRWAWVAAYLVDVLMAWCLLLQAAHWFTDVLGGILLSTAVLAAVGAARRRPG